MKTILLILFVPLCIFAGDRYCEVWHFNKKGQLFMRDTLTPVYNKKYVYCIEGDSSLFYSTTKRSIKKTDWDRSEVVCWE